MIFVKMLTSQLNLRVGGHIVSLLKHCFNFSYFSTKIYVLDAQKNGLIETVLLSTQNKCLDCWLENIYNSGVRSAIRAASQLPGRGPTDVDVAPALAR